MASISNNTLTNAQVATQTSTGGAVLKQPNTSQSAIENKIFKNQPTSVPAANLDSDIGTSDLDRLVNRLLDELKANPTQAKLNELATKAKNLQVAPNFSQDMKNLVQMAQNEPELKDFALKLKEFLKPIADLKTAPLNEQMKNSGIMLEANLKDALTNKFTLPNSINKLFADIKNLSNTNLLVEISELAKDDSLSTNESFTKLNEILQSAKKSNQEVLLNSQLKTLFDRTDKLESMAKFIDKQAMTMEGKGLNLDNKSLDLQISKIKDVLNGLNLDELHTEKLSKNLGFDSNLKDLKLAIKNASAELEEIDNSNEKLNEFAKNISHGNEKNLQDRLQNISKKLSFVLQIADKNGFNAKNNLDEINGLIKQQNIAKNDIDAVLVKTSDDVSKNLSNDVKSTLLNLSSKSSPDSPVRELSNKMLSQIEMHQLVSSIAGGMQTYLPYVWDGVDGGNISFKQGKKQKHYAQIDLNFQKFGQINIMISLSDNKYIDLCIATQKDEFKDLIFQGSQELKRAISEQGLIVSNFSLKTLPKLSLKSLYNNFEKLDMGFDKKI
ncbi:MAG: flagellar hook-length control protein FliK [Campylobacter sp.]